MDKLYLVLYNASDRAARYVSCREILGERIPATAFMWNYIFFAWNPGVSESRGVISAGYDLSLAPTWLCSDVPGIPLTPTTCKHIQGQHLGSALEERRWWTRGPKPLPTRPRFPPYSPQAYKYSAAVELSDACQSRKVSLKLVVIFKGEMSFSTKPDLPGLEQSYIYSKLICTLL